MIANLKNFAKKSTALRIALRGTRDTLRNARYIARGVSEKVDEKLVVFSAFNGKSYTCSPKAVYEYMINDSRFSGYRFVWFFEHPEDYKHLEKNPNTKVIKNQSKECEVYLHQAKYWIFNFRALDHWKPSKEQIYVQCWHGTPLKRLGYDITNSDNAMNSVREIRSKYKTDTKRFSYLLSPCDFVTETFTSAWNLKEFGKEDVILETGYPRNDFLNKYTEEQMHRVKSSLGLEDCDKKIILYAPTWRDNQHDAAKGYVYDNPVDFDYLKEHLSDEYIILFRAHYLVADQFDFEEYKGFIYNVSDYDDINELYIIADLLITDYSSVFFDYAILDRPMLFYMYDMEEYRDELRGFYFDVSQLPGEILKTEEELVRAIKAIDYDCFQGSGVLQVFNETYNRRNDGNASERLVNKVFL